MILYTARDLSDSEPVKYERVIGELAAEEQAELGT